MITDDERESLINASYEQLIAATTEDDKRTHWRDMCYHVKLRSPEQIFKMETERHISAKYAPLMTFEMAENPHKHGERGAVGPQCSGACGAPGPCEPQCDGDPSYAHSGDCPSRSVSQ